jgi:hypothetical protein
MALSGADWRCMMQRNPGDGFAYNPGFSRWY